MNVEFAIQFSQITEPNAAPVWLAYNPNSLDVYTQAASKGFAGFEETANVARRFFSQVAPANRSFLDVGANIGVFTFGVATLGVPVTAIEALPDNFLLLNAGIEKNRLRNVRAHHAAATDKIGLLHISGTSHWGQITDQGTCIPGLTLDHITATSDMPPPALLKIDVEGFEYQVLLGATQLIDNTPDIDIIVEIFSGNEKKPRASRTAWL
jgi:FkbM family methyltransferase